MDSSKLTFVALDSAPDPYVSVQFNSRDFSGALRVPVSGVLLQSFIEELTRLNRELAGEAQFSAGVVGAPSFNLTISTYEHRGQILVQAHLDERDAGPVPHELRSSFIVEEPYLLTRFIAELTAVLEGRGTVATLFADPLTAEALRDTRRLTIG